MAAPAQAISSTMVFPASTELVPEAVLGTAMGARVPPAVGDPAVSLPGQASRVLILRKASRFPPDRRRSCRYVRQRTAAGEGKARHLSLHRLLLSKHRR